MPQNLTPAGEELRALLGGLLLTRHVSQALECCDADDDSQDALARMQQRGFTVLGVSDQGHVVGSLDRQSLRPGLCIDQAEPVAEEHVIGGDEPLLELLRRLQTRHWLFARHGKEISGFVSRSDLQRAPVRMLLFGLISLFEMLLLDLVQHYYSDAGIAKTLNVNRLRQAQRLHAEREHRGEELKLADCLQIADKRDLLLAAPGCSRRLGFDSNKAANRFFVQVEQLRDRLVHANDLIAGSSWEEVLTTTIQLADFVSRHTQPQSD